MNGIMGTGWRKAVNNDILQIRPGPYIAEVPRQITITTVDATEQELQQVANIKYINATDCDTLILASLLIGMIQKPQ